MPFRARQCSVHHDTSASARASRLRLTAAREVAYNEVHHAAGWRQRATARDSRAREAGERAVAHLPRPTYPHLQMSHDPGPFNDDGRGDERAQAARVAFARRFPVAVVRSALIQTYGSMSMEENVERQIKLIGKAADQGAQITCLQELA